MAYNPDAKTEVFTNLPQDLILEGAVVMIKDGTIKDFVKNLVKWKNPDSPAIEVHIETKYNGTPYNVKHLFDYKFEGDTIKFGEKSKLGKYKKKYGHIPKVGDLVKLMTDAEGYLRLKLE